MIFRFLFVVFCFFKQKTAYEMRISDWSSDVCSSDLPYITILGPKERAAQRISIMGICNKFAGIVAPLLFAAAVLRPTDQALFDSLASMTDVARSADRKSVV